MRSGGRWADGATHSYHERMTPLSGPRSPLAEMNRKARNWLIGWWRLIYLGALILVLVVSPSSYTRDNRRVLARHIYLNTTPPICSASHSCAR